MKKTTKDYNCPGLEIIDEMNHQELITFRDLLINYGYITEGITKSDEYKNAPDSPENYRELLKHDFRAYGSNSLSIKLATYKEILIEVCKIKKVSFKRNDTIGAIEHKFIEKCFVDALDRMSEQEKEIFLNEFGKERFSEQVLSLDILVNVFKFENTTKVNHLRHSMLYWLVAYSIKEILLTSTVAIFGLTAPAYRVIIPAVLFIAVTREMHSNLK